MDEINEVITDMMKELIKLPDETGLGRCIAFYRMYEMIKSLKEMVTNLDEQHKQEVLVLKAEIDDLKNPPKSEGE